jgi:hypothetical protein
MTRKIITIDVGEMSLKEACAVIGRKYTPWYKDLTFWSIVQLPVALLSNWTMSVAVGTTPPCQLPAVLQVESELPVQDEVV